jgi:replicative DNA helicase
MAHPEELLISAILRTRDYKQALALGVSPVMFTTFTTELAYIHGYYQRHGRLPEKESFRRKFPDFTIRSVNDIAAYTDAVKEEYARYTMTTLIDNAIGLMQKGQIDAAMTGLGTDLLRTQSVLADQGVDYDITADFERTLKEVEIRHDRQLATGWAGVPTGMGTLDLATGGIQPGWLSILGGRLGQGKTWLLTTFAVQAALKGYSAMFYSLEQSQNEIAMRSHTLLSHYLGDTVFPSSSLQRGYGIDLREYRTFLTKLDDLLPGRLVINDASRGKVSPMTVAAAVERELPDIVFIDYLTLMGMKGDGGWLSVADLSASIKQIALRYDIPIWVGSQLNRTAVRDDQPDASTIARSDSVGHDADLIVTVASKSKSVRLVSVPKFRHGHDGQMFFVKWKPNIGEIEEINGDDASDLMDDDRAVP